MTAQSSGPASLRARISRGVHVEFRYSPGELVEITAEWSPSRPPELGGQALRRYRRARDSFIGEVQRRKGKPLFVLDLPQLSMDVLRDVALAAMPPGGHA